MVENKFNNLNLKSRDEIIKHKTQVFVITMILIRHAFLDTAGLNRYVWLVPAAGRIELSGPLDRAFLPGPD